MKPIIFISGPFRAETEWLRQQNIRRAEAEALWVWQQGGIAICPHKNTEHFDNSAPDKVWLEGDLQILKRCDAIYMVEGWGRSAGAKEEFGLANKLGLATLYTRADVVFYLYECRKIPDAPIGEIP